jgi:predicted ester cyclase
MCRTPGAAILVSGRVPRSATNEEEAMSNEKNKDAVRECLTEASKGNFGALDAIVGESYVLHPDGIRGAQGLAEMVEGYRRALAGLTVKIDHQFTEGDYVATRSTLSGRHEGELMGTPPTGREVSFTMLTISRCRDGRIEEEWEIADTVSLLQQIGALPAMAEA